MQYHQNAVTNIHLREQIKSIHSTNKELSQRFRVSPQTISKWKNREDITDRSSRPKTIKYAITDIEENLAVSIRKSSWLPLDLIHDMLSKNNKELSRDSVYRCFKRHNINQVPKEKREQVKKFKAYSPGYLHVDVTYLPKIGGQKYYLFVAIDRATRLLFFKIYENKSSEFAQQFFDECVKFFPQKINTILTDNGLEFSNKLLKNKKGECKAKLSLFDEKCNEYKVEHRLTRPFTPKTNGMVERVNGVIKQATILSTTYKSKNEMENDLKNFMSFYNLYRFHGVLKKEMKVRTPFEALEVWYRLEPEIFVKNIYEFKQYLLTLSNKKENNFYKLYSINNLLQPDKY